MTSQSRPFLLALSCVCLALVFGAPGCGGDDSNADSQADLATAPDLGRGSGTPRSRGAQSEREQPRGGGASETGLAAMNREWIAKLQAWTQTAQEARDLFASITDDASAEAALASLESLDRRVASEQANWQLSEFGSSFDNDALLEQWEAAEAAFDEAKVRLREERSRVYLAASDNSAMEEAVIAFPHQ